MILYILLCGYPPFNGTSDKAIIDAVKAGHYTLDCEFILSVGYKQQILEPEWDEIS